MKQAIVTGATGFIGSKFVETLSKRGINVLALGRKSFNQLSILRREKLKHATYICIDMQRISELNNKITEVGWKVDDDCTFINLAWGGKNKLSDLNVEAQVNNVWQSVKALEVAHIVGCNKFIQIGSMEEAFTHKYLELDHNINTEYNRHVVYAVAKIAAKRALKIRAHELSFDFIYAINSHVMGPDDDKDSFLQVTLQKLIEHEALYFSSGEQYFDVISTTDCCEGYLKICENGVAGSEYWVGSGEPRTLREYVEIMYSLYPSGITMEFGKLPFNDIRVDLQSFSIEKLIEDTGFTPTMSFESIVHELYEHLTGLLRKKC